MDGAAFFSVVDAAFFFTETFFFETAVLAGLAAAGAVSVFAANAGTMVAANVATAKINDVDLVFMVVFLCFVLS